MGAASEGLLRRLCSEGVDASSDVTFVRTNTIPTDSIQPDFAKNDGLVPVVVRETGSGEVLMMAYMNREAFNETLATGRAVYYSRSRRALWRKGQTSGNVQVVKRLLIDCDRDTLLLEVDQQGGAACHQGYKSCFFREITPDGVKVVGERVFNPDDVYPSQDP